MPVVPAHRIPPRSRNRCLARCGLVLISSVAAVTLVACGGDSSATPGVPSPAPSKAGQPGPVTPPGAFGTIAALNASSMEVQNRASGQTTVNFSSSTTFTNEAGAALADVTAGACVTVTGTGGNGQPITARSVGITEPTSSGCAAGGLRGGAGGGGRTRPSGPNRPRPTGPNGASVSGAFGTVNAVNGNSFTVHGTVRGDKGSDTTITVNVNGSTTYTKAQSATSSALAVGECVAAIGPADDTGAVTAKTITVSKPGANGCTMGLGRGGLGGYRTGGGEGGANG